MVDYIKYKPYTSNNWFNAVKEIQKNRPWITKRITDSMTASQVETKMWIAEEMHNLKLYPENCVVLGGWFAHILTNILIEELGVKFVMNYEIDKDIQWASFKFNRHYKENDMYRCVRKNIMCEKIGKTNLPKDPKNPVVARRKPNLRGIMSDYRHPDSGTGFNIKNFNADGAEGEMIVSYDCIINTSCEHMFPMRKWKEINYYGLVNQRGFRYAPLYILQSTNADEWEDHINCVKSADELAEQAELTDILFSGERELENGMTRFMVIGR